MMTGSVLGFSRRIWVFGVAFWRRPGAAPCWSWPVADSSKMAPPQGTAEPVSKDGGTSVIA